MTIKIIKRGENTAKIDTLTCVIYGAPGVGKTSLALTAEKPLLIDFDWGWHRALRDGDVVDVKEWADIRTIDKKDVSDHRTVIVDTGGRCIDMIKQFVFEQNPAVRQDDGTPTLKGYGAIKEEFVGWLFRLRGCGVNIVITAHMSEQSQNERTMARIDVTGGAKEEIYKCADMIGLVKIGNTGERIVDFSPSATSFGKNPANLAADEIDENDDTFLARAFDQAKTIMTERLRASPDDSDWLAKLTESDQIVVGQLNEAKTLAKTDAEKRKVMATAKKHNFTFNRKTGKFVAAK